MLPVRTKKTFVLFFYSNYLSDGPQDIVVSGSKTDLEGEQISLSCLTDSNPSPSITLYKIPRTTEVQNSPKGYNILVFQLTDYGANMTFPINRY